MNSAPFGDCKTVELHRLSQMQSFGGLVAIDKRTRCICACSANIAGFTDKTPEELLGQPWSLLFSETQVPSLFKAADITGQQFPHIQRATWHEREMQFASHSIGDVTFVEMEEMQDHRSEPHGFDFADRVAYLQALSAADTPEAVAGLLMNAVADITQYDRVLLYRLLPDWNGEVIAESLQAEVPGFLGLRFPAADIPANARLLYTVNRQRIIVDVKAATVALIRAPECPDLDFSFSQLRAVHPVHMEYLRNLGVQASFSVSVLLGTQLWGLVVCHHLISKAVSLERRQLCEELARTAGIHLTDLHAMQEERRRADLRAQLAEILGALRAQNGDKKSIVSQLLQIRQTFRADGLVAHLDDQDFHSGEIPEEASLSALRDSVRPAEASAVAATSALRLALADYPDAARLASGSLYIPLTGADFLLLMRQEQIETVTWAGKSPDPSDSGEQIAQLTPRASFQAWSELVKGTSIRWEEAEIEAAGKLRELLIEYLDRRRLETLALRDPLTGLANRMMFDRSLQEAIRIALKDDTLAAVFILDLDKFKAINDMLGHAAGDELLLQVGNRLKAMMRARDTVARLGGDEFGIVGYHLWKAGDAHRTALRIIQEIQRPFMIGGRQVEIGASIGASICPTDATEPRELLANADLALYDAKRDGRSTFKAFTTDMLSDAAQKESVRHGLTEAMRDGSMFFGYQPMVSSKTRALQSFETFARWRHPDRGELAARDFLPQLEQCQLMAQFAEWGIRQILQQGKQWMNETLPRVPVTLNLSAGQFLSLDLASMCVGMSRELNIGLDWLRFDLEETALQADFPHAAEKIAALSELGIGINIDHFGHGLVPLNRICGLKLNQLNVTGKYFNMGSDNRRNDAMIAVVREVGRVLDLPIVATEIETEAMALRATGAGIDFLQGNVITHPLTADAAGGWLRNTGR